MNFYESVVLRSLFANPFSTVQDLAEQLGFKLEEVIKCVSSLEKNRYLDENIKLTNLARHKLENSSPRSAIILAAGYGMRMVPINLSTPKALVEVNGERLIERLIAQLNAAGINDITVVVGFIKESFEYLSPKYGIELVFNSNFASKNNLHSLALVKDRISNTYIIPCDIWCRDNPFNNTELCSWYMVSDSFDDESNVRVNRNSELIKTVGDEQGNSMIGIAYLTGSEAEAVRRNLLRMDNDDYSGCFWEETLFDENRMILPARLIPCREIVEINTFEQLRELDSNSNHLNSDAIKIIATALKCGENDITDIKIQKKGMTNRSFIFQVNGEKYIMRIPGEGTDQLIDREHEAAVFRAIRGFGFCDDPVYIDPKTGFKITKYLENVRACDSENVDDLVLCMKKLKDFHGKRLVVSHSFDIFGQLEFYESLWDGDPSVFEDYQTTKNNVLSLKPFIEGIDKDRCLTHIDAVSDNFLFYTLPDGSEGLQLTDWEYSGMQDPHVDIAMFIIYSLYNKQQCDRLIDIYFEGACDVITRAKIYSYIAVCGLLWSNWCEFKRKFGFEFGEYALCQYRYAKDYYLYAKELIGHNSNEGNTKND